MDTKKLGRTNAIITTGNGHAALFVPSEMCMVNVYTAIIPIVPVNKRSGWECEKLK